MLIPRNPTCPSCVVGSLVPTTARQVLEPVSVGETVLRPDNRKESEQQELCSARLIEERIPRYGSDTTARSSEPQSPSVVI